MKRVKMVCSHCGSEEVSADAATRWSVANQAWEVTNVFDKGHLCDNCGGECSIEEVEIIPHQALRDACRNVLACWEEGDLASAINKMERELDLIEGLTPRTKKLNEQVLLETIAACWHFIENVTQEDSDRSEKFFALREKVREVTWGLKPERGVEFCDETLPASVVDCAMHIIDGLTHQPNDISIILDIWDRGCFELYHSLIPFAVECDRLYREKLTDDGCFGVFDYEVSCEFGAWYGKIIIEEGNEPDHARAMEKIDQLVMEFFKDGK